MNFKKILTGITFSVLILNLNSQNLTNGLIGHYPFDGNANDVSGNNNNGVLNGPTPAADRFSNPNSAYFFDGNDDVNINNSATLNPTLGISICAWYKSVNFSGNGFSPIFTKGFTSHTSPYYQYKLGVTGNQYSGGGLEKFGFWVTINNVQQAIYTSSGSWTPGNWYFLVGTYDGTQMKLYVNNVLVTSLPATGALTTFSTNIKFGNNTTNPDYLTGTVDDTRIYNRALTPVEVNLLYNNITVINEQKETSFPANVYPNPVKEKLVIEFETLVPEKITVELTNTLGSIVYSGIKEQESTNYTNTIDVSHFDSGLYFIKITTGSKTYFKKILISK